MSALSDAVTALTDSISAVTARVDEDVAHLQDLLAQALQTNVNDAATIATLQADADATVASISASTSALNSIDPLSDFPTVPEPTP